MIFRKQDDGAQKIWDAVIDLGDRIDSLQEKLDRAVWAMTDAAEQIKERADKEISIAAARVPKHIASKNDVKDIRAAIEQMHKNMRAHDAAIGRIGEQVDDQGRGLSRMFDNIYKLSNAGKEVKEELGKIYKRLREISATQDIHGAIFRAGPGKYELVAPEVAE